MRPDRDEQVDVLLRRELADVAMQFRRMLAQLAHRAEHGQRGVRAPGNSRSAVSAARIEAGFAL